MEAIAKVKKFGKLRWYNKKIILPDFCKPYFETYKMEIVECPKLNCLCVYFQHKDKPETDVISHTIYQPQIQQNISDGFKEVFEQLMILEKQLIFKF